MKLQMRTRHGANWKGSPQRIAALVFVCLSIFAWGLRYKLSLYNSPGPARAEVPAAKLLSPKERPLVAMQKTQLSPSWKLAPVAWLASENKAMVVTPTCFSLLSIARAPIHADGLWYDTSVDSRPPPVVA